MRRRWKRPLLILGAALVVIAGLFLVVALDLGPGSRSSPPAETAGSDPRLTPELAPKPPAVARLPRSDASGAPEPDAGPPPPRFKLAGLFDDGCNFGVSGHCAEWAARAGRCDAGDADACVSLGELLIGEAPAQPLWGSMLLERACELGRDAACERGLRWNRWSRYGYSPAGRDAGPLPEGLSAACDAGDQVACGLIEMRAARARTTEPDPDRAMAACRWGFRDVCGIIMETAPKTARALAALKAGCESPDAWLCWHLGRMYSRRCKDSDQAAPCPPRDPAQAKRYMDLACQLDPALAPCRER